MALTQEEYEELVVSTKKSGKTYSEWSDGQSGCLSLLKKSYTRRQERELAVKEKMNEAKIDRSSQEAAWKKYNEARSMDDKGAVRKPDDYEWVEGMAPDKRADVAKENFANHFFKAYVVDDNARVDDIIKQAKKNQTGVNKAAWDMIDSPLRSLSEADVDYCRAVAHGLKILQSADFVLSELGASYKEFGSIAPSEEGEQLKQQEWFAKLGAHIKELGKTYMVLYEAMVYVEPTLASQMLKGSKEFSMFAIQANAEYYGKYGKDMVKDKQVLTFAAAMRGKDELPALEETYEKASKALEAAKKTLEKYATFEMTGTNVEIKLKQGVSFSDPKVMDAWQKYAQAKQAYDQADRMLYPDGNRNSTGNIFNGRQSRNLGQVMPWDIPSKVRKKDNTPPPRMLA